MESIKQKIRSIIRENFIKEMGKNDMHLQAIMKYYDKANALGREEITKFATKLIQKNNPNL